MSEENIENITKSDSNFAPTFVAHHLLPDITFNGHCLIKSNISIPKKEINLCICYGNLNTDFTLNNCLFGSVKLTENADNDKYKYSGYSIRFDSPSVFSFTNGSMGRNVIIFGADMSSPVHIDNKGRDILILGERTTQRVDDTTLTPEAKYPINFTQQIKRFLLRRHYNGRNSFFFLNDTKIYQFKGYTLCLGNISEDFKINNMNKTGLGGFVKLFFCCF